MAEQQQAANQNPVQADESPTNQGTAPYPPPGPLDASRHQRADRPPTPRRVVRGIADGQISWEELRKGLPPEQITTPDQRLYAERFESQEQAIDQPNPAWRSGPQGYPAVMPPEAAPGIEPPAQGQQLTRGNQSGQSKPAGS